MGSSRAQDSEEIGHSFREIEKSHRKLYDIQVLLTQQDGQGLQGSCKNAEIVTNLPLLKTSPKKCNCFSS